MVGKLNVISFHTSQAAASSGLHLQASRIISLPSTARSRPSLRACTHASRATRLATAPGALLRRSRNDLLLYFLLEFKCI
jgi:hypothetical protein